MKKIYLIFFVSLIISSCNNKETITSEDISVSFPVLSYDAEIFESLSLDKSNISISDTREVMYWYKNFQNVKNNLGNIKTSSTLTNKKKIFSGSGKLNNTTSPIFFDEKLCSIDSDGSLYCLNAKSDKFDFRVMIEQLNLNKIEIIRGGITYFDDKIVYADAYGQIKLFHSTNGEVIWSTNLEFPILSSPLIYRGFIYVISSDNRIFAIDINDGSNSWSFQTTAENKKNIKTSSPVAYENLIIAPFSNGELIAFKYDDGRPIWSENVSKVTLVSNFDIRDISANPVINGSNIYTISNNGKLISTNIINGQRNWSIDISGSRTPIISGNVIFVTDKDSRLVCININTGEIYWITELDKFRKGNKVKDSNLWLSPYLINNLIYNISYFGEIKIVSPKTGEILATQNLGIKGIVSQPIILQDRVYVVDERSNVFRIE
tara:strand:- start:345 stop:1646 length:1302 start_codon:yes stop_codon:yes gene_type:complete